MLSGVVHGNFCCGMSDSSTDLGTMKWQESNTAIEMDDLNELPVERREEEERGASSFPGTLGHAARALIGL